jgi:hypothetical protein
MRVIDCVSRGYYWEVMRSGVMALGSSGKVCMEGRLDCRTATASWRIPKINCINKSLALHIYT